MPVLQENRDAVDTDLLAQANADLNATLVFAPEPIRADNRKTLAALLHQACLDIFTPTDRTPDGHNLPTSPRP
jgi:hypothetical protein